MKARKRERRALALALALVVLAGLLPAPVLAASGNSTSATARAISPNVSVTGALDGKTDANYYKVDLWQNGCLKIKFDHEAWDDTYSYWDVYLLDSAFHELCVYSVPAKSPNTIGPPTGVPAGTYYIKVLPYSSTRFSTASYQLTAVFEASESWEREPANNLLTGATTILPNTPVNGVTYGVSDYDYFKLVLLEPGVLSLELAHEAWSTDKKYWDVTLYTVTNSVLGGLSAPGASTTTTSSEIGLPAGTYYVRVTSTSSSYYSNWPYQLTAQFTPRTDWEREFNNTAADANPIALNTPVSGQWLGGYTGDDYFTFTLDKPAQVSLWFEHDHIDSSRSLWSVYLLDSAEAPLETLNCPGNTTKSESEPVALDAGTYYVRVTNYSSSYYSEAVYTLTAHSDVIPPAAVTVPVGELALAVGDVRWLSSSVVKGATWSSSNTAVATVSPGGVVTAVGPGAADVTCVTDNGVVTFVCSVQVAQRTGADFLLGPITLHNTAGDRLFALPGKGDVWVTVPVTRQAAQGSANVLVAAYDANGRMLRMVMANPVGLGQGQSLQLRFSMPSAGVARFKAFAVRSISNLAPVAGAVEFPAR